MVLRENDDFQGDNAQETLSSERSLRHRTESAARPKGFLQSKQSGDKAGKKEIRTNAGFDGKARMRHQLEEKAAIRIPGGRKRPTPQGKKEIQYRYSIRMRSLLHSITVWMIDLKNEPTGGDGNRLSDATRGMPIRKKGGEERRSTGNWRQKKDP